MQRSALFIATFCVLAASFLFVETTNAQTPWLRNWPTAEQVKADIRARGGDASEADIDGRQAGRLMQMADALREFSPHRSATVPRGTRRTGVIQIPVVARDVEARRRQYLGAHEEIAKKYGSGNECPFIGECRNNVFSNSDSRYRFSIDAAHQVIELYPGISDAETYTDRVGANDNYGFDKPGYLTEKNYGLSQFIAQAVKAVFWLVLIAILIALFAFFARQQAKNKSWREAQYKRTNDKFLQQFGTDMPEQVDRINRSFDKRTTELRLDIDYVGNKNKQRIACTIGRSISSMSPRDREVLRSTLLLRATGLNRGEHNTWIQLLGIVYGDGKGTVYGGWTYTWPGYKTSGIKEGVEWLIKPGNLESSVNLALAELTDAINKEPNNPLVRDLVSRVLGGGSDLSSAPFLQSITNLSQPSEALILGEDEQDASRLMTFNGQGSLITVAPPGSGKTQCHVIPNLLNWPGPAVVLDIKGEIFEATSGWRAANVGPVYRFDPLSPAKSHSYNPLLAVADDPDHIWEDSRFLADMLIVPGGKAKDPFWESRARDVLTAAIAVTVRGNAPDERGMGKVLDILHGVGWDRFIARLDGANDVPTMARSAKSLGEMDEKMRSSVLQTALASLSAWEGARIARTTSKSDWSPADLRSGDNPTIYICIAPNQIDSYVSMLRVIIAQHIRALTAHLPEQQGRPILFILDELPRLRYMPPVEEALEIGRQYGIKLWMFTQSLGQLETAYENAEGMVGSCALRMFMNPSLHDETAQKLSDDMGYRESVIDGTRVKRVEANVLAGPEFKDMVIVMASSAEPARVRKHFAHADTEMSRRMQMPAAGTQE